MVSINYFILFSTRLYYWCNIKHICSSSIVPSNVKTPINYSQHYHQTHNIPITTKSTNNIINITQYKNTNTSTITTLSTYVPFTSITSITTPYNQILYTH
eukprot:383829_1